MKTSKILLPGIVALLLSGCATTMSECNPHDSNASIFTKISCDSSGAYRAHIDQQEEQLLSAQEANALFHQIYKDIEAQREASSANVAQQRDKQNALNRSVAQLLRSISAKQSKEKGVQKQINDVESELKRLNQTTASASPAAEQQKQQQLQQLQQQVSRLQTSLGYD